MEDERDCLMFHGVKKDAMEVETDGNLVSGEKCEKLNFLYKGNEQKLPGT